METASAGLRTLRDWVRFGASAFNEAGLCFGHGTDNAFDEALALVLHALHLNHDVAPEYLDARLTQTEAARVHALFSRRIVERIPAAYLTNEARFAGLSFYVDERVVVPRSPIAELIEQRFEPWLGREPRAILDLCCGSGCIGIACALTFPDAAVTLADRDPGALDVARRNVAHYGIEDRVRIAASDLFSALSGEAFDLIACNPPYVDSETYAALPQEYRHEPRAGLESGGEGLDHPRTILAASAEHLSPEGILMLEVGARRASLEKAVPNLEAVWLEFERGGEGVAAITREALAAPGALQDAA